MTTTTPSTTELDGLLDLVLAAPLWTAEPTADRLAMTLALDPSAARPSDLFEEAKRNGWDDFRTAGAWLYDRECHAAVRRRADDVTFHVQRITALLGRCVDLPANTANKIRDLLRDGLLRNATRDGLVSILLAAGASTAAPAIRMLDEPADEQAEAAVEPAGATTRRPASKQRQRDAADLQAFLQKRHTAKIMNALTEPREDQKAIAEVADVTEQIVKNYTREQHRHKLWKEDEEGRWILTSTGFAQLKKSGLEVNPTSAQIQTRARQCRESPRK